MSYLRYLYLFAYNDVLHILCCVFCFVCHRLVCRMLPVSLDCPFLIVPSVNIIVFVFFFNNLTLPLSIESINIRYQGRGDRLCGSKHRNCHKYPFYSVEETRVPK